jgi:hypothetical protein
LVADTVIRDTVLATTTGHAFEELLEIADIASVGAETQSARESEEPDSSQLLDHIDDLVREPRYDGWRSRRG